MHTDHKFVIGVDHSVCQDYATSGKIGEDYFAIVSDGCSSAPDTDYGARILVRHGVNLMSKFDFDKYPLKVLEESLKTVNFLNFDPVILASTFLAAKTNIKENKISIMMIGDGVIFGITNDNDLYIQIIEYKNNAPYYLYYQMSPQRKKEFVDYYSLSRKVRRIFIDTNNKIISSTVVEDEFDGWYTETSDLTNFKVVGLISDGALSFNQPDDIEVIKELINFKSYPGEFVDRRLNGLKNNLLTKDWRHSDDLSMAAIFIDQNKDNDLDEVF